MYVYVQNRLVCVCVRVCVCMLACIHASMYACVCMYIINFSTRE